MVEKFIGFVGLLVMLGIAFLICKPAHRKQINLRVVIGGILMQVIFAVLILKTPVNRLFDYANTAVNQLLNFTNKGLSLSLVR